MTNPVSRRRLLTSGFAASFLAASGTAAFSLPRRGGLLRLGLQGAPGNWDSRLGLDPFRLVAGAGSIFDCLTEIAADGSLRGELALRWHASENATVWDFELRDGVRFHNGKAFGAEDVIASLELHRGAATPAAAIVGQIIGFELLDRHNLRLVLARSNPDFPLFLADPHLIIFPHGDIRTAMNEGIGTGLYRVGRDDGNNRLTAWRIEDHYKGNHAGQFTEIELISMSEASERAEALEHGRIHATHAGLEDPIPAGAMRSQGFSFPTEPEAGAHFVLHSAQLEGPSMIGGQWPLDNGRIAERWWRA